MQNEGSAEGASSGVRNCGACFPLLSLPQPPLMVVIQCLDRWDRRSLVNTCRSLARAVSAVTKDTQVKITPSTDWGGLCKVLITRTIVCNSLWLYGADTWKPRPSGWLFWRAKPDIKRETATSVLLKTGASSFTVPGICKASIHVQPLPCFLPSRIASLLPDLEELEVACGWESYSRKADLQPIPYCSTLRRICFDTRMLWPLLPEEHHTSDDLQRQLPNVVALEIRWYSFITLSSQAVGTSAIQTLINAWSEQLTELVSNTNVSQTAQLQNCTRLQSLKWHADSSATFATIFPKTLRTLHLSSSLSETQLQTILQLPQLRVFKLQSFYGDLRHDWSKHPCSKQQLSVHTLPIIHLSSLPLRSLIGPGCLSVEYLEMPDALLAYSLSDVQHAVQCVSKAGITIDGFRDWDFKLSQHHQDGQLSKVDTALAEMVRAACTVLTTRKCLEIRDTRYTQVTVEMIIWLLRTVVEMQMPTLPKRAVWLWAALCRCNNLVSIKISGRFHGTDYVQDVSDLVIQASEFYVEATHRPVMLIFEKYVKIPSNVVKRTTRRLINCNRSCFRHPLCWKTLPGNCATSPTPW